MINKDTKLYGSFSSLAGNRGCLLFNSCFYFHNINAIYKSFSIDNVEKINHVTRWLNFSGFALSMPFKKQILEYVDEVSSEAQKIQAANTVVNKNGKFIAYNTDYLAAKDILMDKENKSLVILGNGGYAAAVSHAARSMNFNIDVITRKDWQKIVDIKNSIVFSCTPVSSISVHKSNEFIDCLVDTDTGKKLGMLQASYQYKLYTGLDFPLRVQ